MLHNSDQAEDVAAWEKAREEDRKKLQRDRAVLERQSRALVRLPTKKECAEVITPPCSSVPCHLQVFKWRHTDAGDALHGKQGVYLKTDKGHELKCEVFPEVPSFAVHRRKP